MTVCGHVCMTCEYVCMYVCPYVCVYVCMYVCVYVCVYVSMYKYVCMERGGALVESMPFDRRFAGSNSDLSAA